MLSHLLGSSFRWASGSSKAMWKLTTKNQCELYSCFLHALACESCGSERWWAWDDKIYCLSWRITVNFYFSQSLNCNASNSVQFTFIRIFIANVHNVRGETSAVKRERQPKNVLFMWWWHYNNINVTHTHTAHSILLRSKEMFSSSNATHTLASRPETVNDR